MNSAKIIQEQINAYRDNFLLHKDSPQGTYQNNEETQHLRYEMLISHLLNSKEENTIEDIGCGIGDLYGYLKSKNLKLKYSGTEIISEMIDRAKEKYPEISVRYRDILKGEVHDKYDFVVLSGTLNIPGNIDRGEWKKFCYSLIKRMFTMCNKAISFNLLTTHNTFTDPNLFYLDPAEVVDFCLNKLSRFVELRHNYALYEGSVTVYTEDHIEKQFNNQAFARYFRHTK